MRRNSWARPRGGGRIRKDHMDQRFEYIEGELAEIKSALRVKGII